VFASAFYYRLGTVGAMLRSANSAQRAKFMNDVIYVVVMVGFFVIAAIYAHLCEKL
jgi:hypothetical protein